MIEIYCECPDMKELNTLLKDTQISPQGSQSADSKAPTGLAADYAASTQGQSRQDHVDAINQMFAEFELAYHNQFHKAYSKEGSVALAKKYWLSCLATYSPDLLVKATRQVVSKQEYLPTLASIIQACDNAWSLFGLPDVHDAYIEACCAPLPKQSHNWSHPAVYLAGKATDWFALANQPEAKIFPLFEYHYRLLCKRVVNGEQLDIPLPEALPENPGRELAPEENQDKLAVLRKSLKL